MSIEDILKEVIPDLQLIAARGDIQYDRVKDIFISDAVRRLGMKRQRLLYQLDSANGKRMVPRIRQRYEEALAIVECSIPV